MPVIDSEVPGAGVSGKAGRPAHLTGIMVVGAVGAVVVALLTRGAVLQYPGIGTHDFLEYWSAFQLFRAGESPYDPALLLELERGLGWEDDVALMMWNPPWLLLILAPVLSLPFSAAAKAWLFLTPVFLLGTGALVLDVLAKQGPVSRRVTYGVYGAAVAFFPVLNSLALGQLGLLLAFGAALLYWSICLRRYGGIPVALLLLSVKPHLFLLMGVALLWWLVATGRRQVIYWSVAVLAGSAAATMFVNPGALASWVSALWAPTDSPELIPAGSWAGSTLASAAREALVSLGVQDPGWVTTAVPAAAIGLLAWKLHSGWSVEPWRLSFPLLLCLSAWFASFGWLFDHSALLLVQLVIVGEALRGSGPGWARWGPVALLAMIQAAVVLLIAGGYNGYHHYWWFPGAMGLAYWASTRTLGTTWHASG